VVAKIVDSKSEAKRLIDQGAVDLNGSTIKDPRHKIVGGEKLKIGKKTFVKVKTKK
jgi:tyrosyl-tRNA synthetase